jgi:uncharacterized membrane protein
MLVFLTTSHRGRWSPSLLHDGYNACLSLTVLPTMFLRWTRVSDPYVFKVFFQLLYAVCPVLVYQLGRRVASPVVGLVSAVYFIGFVGFVQDMPMLNRQEVAFLFFAAALLVLFLSEQADRTRRLGFCAFGAGMVVSHYSTSYFAAAVFVGLLVLHPVATRLLPRLRRTRSDGTTSSFPLTWWTVGLLLATVVVWNGPANHTGSHLTASVTSAVRAALGHGGERAPETAYSVAGGSKKTTEAAAFDGLLAQERAVRDRHPDAFIPAPPPSATLTPLVPRQTMPATSLGRTLTGSADNARRLNRLWRTAAALGLQLLPAIGLLLVLLRRRWSGEVAVEAALLAVVTLVVLAAQVVLPVLSLDYGVARSFMQALMVLGPFVAIGTVALMQGPLARVRLGAAMAVALAFFATTSGLVPQLLGSYGAQLHLNNSGDYYDRFYLHPEEVAALGWLDAAAIRSSPRYPDIQMDRDLFNKARSLGGVRAYDDIYPSDIHRDAYVVLGYPNVTTGRTLVPTSGFQLWLRYPENVLAASKSLVYTNGATRIYR